jgi:prepilin-type processing-associated H-X9-DG protein
MIYRDDYSGSWPSCWYSVNDPNPNISGYGTGGYAFWMRMLKPYVKSRFAFKCPSAKRKYNMFADTATVMQEWPAANYGINEYLVHRAASPDGSNYCKEGSLRFPSKTALLADCMATLFHDWDDPGVSKTGPDGITLTCGLLRLKYADTYDQQFNKGVVRHNGEQVVFADGHTESVRIEAFTWRQVGDKTYQYPIINPGPKYYPAK